MNKRHEQIQISHQPEMGSLDQLKKKKKKKSLQKKGSCLTSLMPHAMTKRTQWIDVACLLMQLYAIKKKSASDKSVDTKSNSDVNKVWSARALKRQWDGCLSCQRKNTQTKTVCQRQQQWQKDPFKGKKNKLNNSDHLKCIPGCEYTVILPSLPPSPPM